MPEGLVLAIHAHNDGIELLGEIGIVGSLILILTIITYFKKLIQNINQGREFLRFFLISSLFVILFIQSFVDFSLHIPGISIFLAVILSSALIQFKKINK